MKRFWNSIAFKSIAGIVTLLVVFTALLGYIGYRSFGEAVLTQYADGAFRTADIAALSVNADRIDEYAQSTEDAAVYRAVWISLDQICNSSGSTFVYVIQPDLTDYAHITFIFSTKNRKSDYELFSLGYVRETTNDEYKEKYRALYEGTSDHELVVRDKGYISTDPHITAMRALKDSKGNTRAILCVQRQMDALFRVRQRFLFQVVVLLCFTGIAVAVGLWLYLRHMLLLPVERITLEASRFAREGTAADTKLTETIRHYDEMGLLASSIDQMEEQIENYVEDLTAITAEKERIGAELGLARRIQEDMLPNKFPAFPERSEFDIYASMDPAREVGGDFYDFFLVDEDHLYLLIADVSGKGVPAALFMTAGKILLGNNAFEGNSPSQILERTNAAICAGNPENMFLTVWLGKLEISTGRLTAANAGHEDPTLRRAGGNFELIKDRHDFVVGGMEGMVYHDYELQLEPGDRIFVYTDGVPEASDADNNMFGTARMLDALNRNPGASAQEVLGNVRSAVDDFVKDAEQFDDLTMLCLSYEGPDGAQARRGEGE